MHPRRLRCSSLKYSRYSRSSRLAGGAPRPSRGDARLSPRAANTGLEPSARLVAPRRGSAPKRWVDAKGPPRARHGGGGGGKAGGDDAPTKTPPGGKGGPPPLSSAA